MFLNSCSRIVKLFSLPEPLATFIAFSSCAQEIKINPCNENMAG